LQLKEFLNVLLGWFKVKLKMLANKHLFFKKKGNGKQ